MGWCCLPRPKQQENPYSHSVGGISAEKNIRLFSYSQLRSATDNFNHKNKVGRGGCGTVYKGTTRNMQEVVVKVLSAESRQGSREFLTEIDVISNVKHPNLVELIGCCVEADNRILLYEYLENSSLDRALLGSNSDPAIFTWSIRSGICLGVAKGLAYLHEEIPSPIVQRDIKASNILIDNNYVPKIGDFGLAKLFPDNITHISTRVAGTTGYLAPEYAWHGQLTKKADIYSFGVLVIEIISGLSGSRSLMAEDKLILEKTWELYEEGKLEEMVDPAVGTYPQEEAIRYLKVALFCMQAAAARRPSMPRVVKMLSKPIRINESELTAPGYISSEYKSSSSKAAMASTDPRLKNSATEDSDMFSTVVPTPVPWCLILNILKQTWELYEEGKLEEMVDPAVGTYPQEEAIRYLKVALFCMQAAAARRPSMPRVVKMLSKPIRINESELTAPGYISSEYKSSSSKAAMASTDPRLKNSATEDSDMFSTVVPQTVTDVSPR